MEYAVTLLPHPDSTPHRQFAPDVYQSLPYPVPHVSLIGFKLNRKIFTSNKGLIWFFRTFRGF